MNKVTLKDELTSNKVEFEVGTSTQDGLIKAIKKHKEDIRKATGGFGDASLVVENGNGKRIAEGCVRLNVFSGKGSIELQMCI